MSAKILVVDDSPTIRKVVSSILEAHSYEVLLAGDGRDALTVLGQSSVDLIMLDFVMPRMNGFQFCREIRGQDALKDLPVVLMSAKGDKIRGQFVRQTGAIDSITKPFDARGLIAVVEGALKKKNEGRTRATIRPDEDGPLDSSASGLHLSADPGARRAQAVSEFALELARQLTPSMAKSAGFRGVTPEQISSALRDAVTAEAVSRLAGLLKSVEFGENERQVLSGDLSVVSVAEILQLLTFQRKSGALSVFTQTAEVVLFLRQGDLDYASWRGLTAEFLLGRYLVEEGLLTRAELQTVLDNRAGSKRLLGETLVVLGFADEAQIQKALERQTSELVYEVVRWTKGRFVFHVNVENPIAEKTRLGAPTGGLVMEGFRRVDEWRVIEGSFDFEEVLYCDQLGLEQLGDASQLTPMERRVLAAIDGENTVREIVADMGGSSFEVCKILYQFLNSRLVRRKAQ
ncbi:MAG: response regulator [Polyangiaceae bacterium]|nr:response regulator [Polyangiaceae bacterium]